MKHDKKRTSTVPTSPQRKTSLERSVRNMKLVIAGLSVALVACVVYIVTLPEASTSDPSGMTGSYPPAASPSAPANVPQASGSDGAAEMQQVPASTSPAPAPVPSPAPSATPAAATGQQAGKINPPHGQPGHRCDVPVGSALP